jgi:signal peptidase II
LAQAGTGPLTRRAATTVMVLVAAGVFVVDQLTKWWAVNALDTRSIHLFWTFDLELARNTGASFSMGAGRGGLIAVLAIVVVVVLLVVGRAADTTAGAVLVGMILGGALGNLADRAFRDGSGILGGAVVDWINPGWWPVFNVADACVVVGGILLVLVGFRQDRS